LVEGGRSYGVMTVTAGVRARAGTTIGDAVYLKLRSTH
jgi:hypothetical protein